MSELVPGGPTTTLPEGWMLYGGYPTHGSGLMIWGGRAPATPVDIKALHAAGYKEDPASLVGTLDINWSAVEYANKHSSGEDLDPWETIRKPGGRGSARYKFQHLPKGVRAAEPRWWIHYPPEQADAEGRYAHRAKGGEPVTKVVMSDDGSMWDWHFVPDLEISYDPELELWRT